jgi:hypothetical protein
MSKKRGLSADEKQKALMDLYLEEVRFDTIYREEEKKREKLIFQVRRQVTVWNLKELEKVAPKKKGIGTCVNARVWRALFSL